MEGFGITVHTERLHDDRVWRRVVMLLDFLARRGLYAVWFSVNPSYEGYRRRGFDEDVWIDRLAYLRAHGQEIEQHTHFYKHGKGDYDLSPENVKKRLYEDRSWLMRNGYHPTRFVSGGWRASETIRRALESAGYEDYTEHPRTRSPRKVCAAIATMRAGRVPPLLYFHDYELCDPRIYFCIRLAVAYWHGRHFPVALHPHDHKRFRDWHLIFGFLEKALRMYGARSVLELGAGTGNISAYCARRGMRAVAEDINPTYLAAVAARNGSIETLCHDINDPLPYPDRSFDVVVCIGALHYSYVKDPDAVMREMARVARTGVLVDFLSRYSPYRFFELIYNPTYLPRTYSSWQAAQALRRAGLRIRSVRGGRTLPLLGSIFPFLGKTAYYIAEKNDGRGVFFITTIFPPVIGGPATHVARVTSALFARGWRVGVATYARNPSSAPFPVISVAHTFPFSMIRLAWVLITAGRRYPVWYAHGGVSATLPALIIARLLGRRFGIKITGDYAWETARNRGWTALNIDDFQKGSHGIYCGIAAYMRALVARHADFVVVPSRYLEAMVIGWGVAVERITVIPNAITHRPLIGGVERDPFLFFSAGRLVSWKNFDALLRAFARSFAADPRARLIIAGRGPEEGCLRLLAAKLGISDAVSFAGALSEEAMADLYDRAGCFVLYSEYEGMPHVLIEARAHGAPIITADSGGCLEVVRAGVDAAVVRFGDEDALFSAMAGFLENPASVPCADRASPSTKDCFMGCVARLEKILELP